MLGLFYGQNSWGPWNIYLRGAELVDATVVRTSSFEYRADGVERIGFKAEFDFTSKAGVLGGGEIIDYERQRYSVGQKLRLYWHPETLEWRFISVRYPLYVAIGIRMIGVLLVCYWLIFVREPPSQERPADYI
jgi:hypothetical protein